MATPEIAYADNYEELVGKKPAETPVVETKVVSAPVKAAAKAATAEVK
jgi:hypothetical protein